MRLKDLSIRSFFKYKYTKLIILVATITLAYKIFRDPEIASYLATLQALSYLGVFIGGILFVMLFSAPFGIGFFLTLNPANIWLAAIIGGLGAMVGDMLIFKFIKASFEDEIKQISDSKHFQELSRAVATHLGEKIKIYLTYAIAGFVIASPLPDEAGVFMLAGLKKINIYLLMLIAFILNAIGIAILLGVSA